MKGQYQEKPKKPKKVPAVNENASAAAVDAKKKKKNVKDVPNQNVVPAVAAQELRPNVMPMHPQIPHMGPSGHGKCIRIFTFMVLKVFDF